MTMHSYRGNRLNYCYILKQNLIEKLYLDTGGNLSLIMVEATMNENAS